MASVASLSLNRKCLVRMRVVKGSGELDSVLKSLLIDHFVTLETKLTQYYVLNFSKGHGRPNKGVTGQTSDHSIEGPDF